MKKIILLGILLLVLFTFRVYAQTTRPGINGSGKAGKGSSMRSATNDSVSAGSGKAGGGKSGGGNASGTGSLKSTTVDGSDGSATNDGASGQDGSPTPIPALSGNRGATKGNRDRKVKSSTATMSHAPRSSN